MSAGSEVIIDGIKYFPENRLDAEANKLLHEIYCGLWTEAYYDAFNDYTRAFARPLADKITALNKIMGFKK